MRRLFVVVALAALLASGLAVADPSPEPAEAGRVVKVKLRKAIKQLPVRVERRAGYARSKFRHWTDGNRDCQDTRAEVLVRESKTRARGGCTIRRGKWRSYYDGRVHRRAGALDVDHLVPLAEAWDSGARRWNVGTRRRFANDLADGRSLVAVTAGVNRSKSDRDPRQWMPRRGKCRYVREWVAVKHRWSLSVDRREKRKLRRVANRCANKPIRFRKARVARAKERTGGRLGVAPAGTYACPRRAPIKGNRPSMIFHPPASPWYDRTTPERCFATAKAARRAGYRRASF